MSVDKPISDAPTIKDRLRFASESALEEFELELPGLIKEWEEFIKDNPGISFRDWYHSKEPTRVIQLKNGGDVEKYEDLIDAFEKGIDVMPGEDLTKYIRRIRSAELRALMEESK
jgi:hypothetical protein|tara:strand:+ start:332 stop:676 length:345 start_codon:yes stop_codon:yes gene_type:complete